MIFKLHKKLKTINSDIFALFGYTILTLLMTYPMIFKMNYYTGGDVSVFIWSFWWVKHALLDFHTNLFYTYYLYYPVGMDLSLYTLTYFNTLFSLPLQLIFNEIVTFNIMVLFSFVMSGFGVFLLVKYLTKNTKAAFISGVIFAFSPFRFAHIAHLTVISTEWIPFFILYLIKTIKEKSMKNAILGGLFLSLTALSEWHYLLFLSIFSLLILLYYLKVDRRLILSKQFLTNTFIISLVFLSITFPFLLALIQGAVSNPQATRPLDPSIIASADLFAFLTPAKFHPIFGKYVSWAYELFTRDIQENTVFLGYTTIALSIYALLKIDRKKTKFWILSAVIFLILALGPVLHVFGKFLFTSPIPLGDFAKSIGLRTTQLGYDLLNKFIGIPLPYLLLHLFVPYFSLLREPARFTILAMLSFSVLAGYGMMELFKIKRYNNLLFFLILFLILFEFLAVPLELREYYAPKFYYQLTKDKDDYAILEVPIDYSGYGGEVTEPNKKPDYMLLQIIHNKRLISGAFTRKPPNTTYFIDTTPLLLELRDPYPITKAAHDRMMKKVLNANPEAAEIIGKYLNAEEDIYSYSEQNVSQAQPSKADIKKLQENNIRYILIHKNYIDKDTFIKMNNLLIKLLPNSTPVYEDKELLVYKI